MYEGPLAKKSTENERKEQNAEKHIQLLTTLSLTRLVYLHSFSSCVRRNLQKFSENLNLYSSRSSKVIDLGVSQKLIYATSY